MTCAVVMGMTFSKGMAGMTVSIGMTATNVRESIRFAGVAVTTTWPAAVIQGISSTEAATPIRPMLGSTLAH